MKTVTWVPGSNEELDNEFENLRKIQFSKKSHRLHKNYDEKMYEMTVALTICYDVNGIPEMCSSIAHRKCWPNQAYRILNRLWKHSNIIKYPRIMSPSFAETASSQIQWLTDNTDFKLCFISRETDNWEDWVIKNFKDSYNIHFKKDSYKYLTCMNENDNVCWQKIIYIGEDSVLNHWKKI